MATFYDTIRNSPYFGHDTICKDLNMLEPGTRAAVVALMDDVKAQNIELRVLETYRSQTRQSALFAKHATQLRTVGCHGYGVACDFGVFVNGTYQPDDKAYQFLRQAARRHGLISGIDWGHAAPKGFEDSDHVQRVPVWRQNAMFNGSWYPPTSGYDPYVDSIANGHADVVGGDASPTAVPVKVSVSAAPAPQPGAYAVGSIEWVQEKLNEWAPSFKLNVDGSAGPKTTYAVKRYQQEHKLRVSGIADAPTIKLLAS